MVVMVGGLMGTGKNTLAHPLSRELGWALISSDAVRKRLAGIAKGDPQDVAFGRGVYSTAWTERTYAALTEETRSALRDGRCVVLDASFARQSERQALAREAAVQRARCVFVECHCARKIALRRLARRWEARLRHRQTGSHLASVASDGRPA